MVGEKFLGLGVHHVYLVPVRAVARDDVGRVFAVVGEAETLEGHGAVVGEGIGIEEHFRCASERIRAVEHALVL